MLLDALKTKKKKKELLCLTSQQLGSTELE